MTDIQIPSSHERDTTALDLRLDDSTAMPSLPSVRINAKRIGGIWRGSGCFKINTTWDDLKKLNITRRNSTSEPLQAFPTILELAQLSQHSYKISDLKDGKEVPFEIDKMSDWICIGTARYSDGYCGAAYVNHKHSHVVIAHGGTEFNFKKLKELYRDVVKTDIGGVFLNQEVSQISSAYIFTKIIVNLCSDTQFSISVTGHSLGGWLAQISAFYIEHPNYTSLNKEVKEIIEEKQINLGIPGQYVETNKTYHLHTVSFDSPGCRQALKKITGYYDSKTVEWRENVETLDLTVIIAPSNSVNTCGEHVGYVLELEMKGVKEVSWIIESHGIQNFVDHLSVPHPKLKEVHNVYWWKPVQSSVESIIIDEWYLGRESSCQLNIFSPNEFLFLTRTQAVLKWIYNESLASSEKNMFEEQRHEQAGQILDDIKFINDFILNFTITHNVIEFPKNSLDEKKLNMSELILTLVRLLRQNRVWWNGTEESIRNVIMDLPKCREMVCESEESLYVEGIPKLRYCTTIDLCNIVRLFLASDEHFWSIARVSSDRKECRLYMVHLYHCFQKYCQDSIVQHSLFLNISSVQRLKREIEMENIFSQTKFELIVVECDVEIHDMNVVIRGMIANAKERNKKLILVTSGEHFQADEYPLLESDDLSLQFDNLNKLSKEVISQCPVNIHGNTFMLGMLGQPDTTSHQPDTTHGQPDQPCGQYQLNDLRSFFKSVSLASDIICDIFYGKNIDLSCVSLPIMAQHYISRTLFQITLNTEELKEKVNDFSDVIVVSNSVDPIRDIFPELIPLGENLIQVPIGQYTKLDFLIACESEYKTTNVHWFKREESMLVWQMSSGQPCFDYLVSDEGVRLDLEKLKGKATEFSDILVISNCDRSTETLIPDTLFRRGRIRMKDDGYTKESFLDDCRVKLLSKNVHWFKQKGSMFVWEMSNGQPCFDYLVRENGGILDSNLHVLQNNFIILADEPGMGKSAAITKLFLDHRDRQFHSLDSQFNWPVYINLNDHQVELKDMTYSSKAAMTFLTKASNLNCDFEKSLFKFCLEKVGNLTFFIDSFDEISLKGQDFVVQMLQHLKEKKNSKIRVWIATRNYAKYELETKLGTKSYKFFRIENDDQRKFLVNYWMNNVPFERKKNDDRIETFAVIFADRAITAIQNVLGTDHTFIGIPLQLVLLAAIYNESFHQLLEHKLGVSVVGTPLRLSENDWRNYSDKFSTTFELYYLFVEKKMHLWLGDKYKFDTRTDWMENTLKSRMNEIHGQAAFSYVSSSILTDSNIKKEPFSPADANEMNRVGFCEISDVSESNFRFYHQTIAEYYTAKYLVDLIRRDHKNKVVSFLKTHYHKPYFKKIRYFLDSLLCKDIPDLKNLELLDTRNSIPKIESLRESLKDRDWHCVDALDRNILHYAMAYGDHDSGIFWMIEKDLSLFHKKDLLGETCLSYLCLWEGFSRRVFPHVIDYRYYLERNNIPTHLRETDKDFVPRIRGVQVLYSIFCGSNFQRPFFQHAFNLLELNKLSGINTVKFLNFITSTGSDQLCRNVEINMTWLTTNYTLKVKNDIAGFLSRLCLHNSLDKTRENKLVDVWFEACLSKKGGCGFVLGTKLIKACKGIDNLYDYVLKILRTNPLYYHNALPYMDDGEEFDLWKSCTGVKDKRTMLLVMKNHNFFSLSRSKLIGGLFDEVTEHVYRGSGGEFRDAMNEGLVIGFHVFTFAKLHYQSYRIYRGTDDDLVKEKMITENFDLKTNSKVKPKLSVSLDTFQNIRDGMDEVWTLRPLPEIMSWEYQSHFFRLPVLAEYPNEYTSDQ